MPPRTSRASPGDLPDILTAEDEHWGLSDWLSDAILAGEPDSDPLAGLQDLPPGVREGVELLVDTDMLDLSFLDEARETFGRQ